MRMRKRAVRVFIEALCVILVSAGVLYAKGELLKAAYPAKFSDIVLREASDAGLDPALVFAVIKTESSFRPEALSRAGARGLMQLTPPTVDYVISKAGFDQIGEGDIFDPSTNIKLGCWLLAFLLERYDHPDTALCAYNAGMGNVGRWLLDPELSPDGVTIIDIPFPETRAYVKKVNEAREIYQKLYFSR